MGGVNSYLKCFVTKEVNFFEAFILDVLQAVCFIPTMREDIKRYLATDRERQTEMGELLAQNLYEFYANLLVLFSYNGQYLKEQKLRFINLHYHISRTLCVPQRLRFSL